MTTATARWGSISESPRRPTPGWLIGPLAALALLAAACSSGGGSSVASLSGHPASSGALSGSQIDRDMESFTQCMRAHGVQMSSPYHRAGHTGLTLDPPPQDASTQAAYAVCGHFIAALYAAKAAGAASEVAHNLAELTDYARCMRTHDIDMLDPTAQGQLNLGDVPGITDDFGRYSPQFRAADHACRHLLPAGVHDDGSGP
jgi:hypothetical protein